MKKILLILSIGLFSCAPTRTPHYIIVGSVKHLKGHSLIKPINLTTGETYRVTYNYPHNDVKIGDTVKIYYDWIVMPRF